MAEPAIETLPPAVPDYPLWQEVMPPAAMPVRQRTRSSAPSSAARPRVLSEEPGRRPTREDEAP